MQTRVITHWHQVKQPATVPSSLDGTYNLTYGFAQPGSPFTDGTTATFTISNNELTVEVDGFECITLKNPVLIGTNNYKFKDDCRDNIGYNVSPNNDGSFNEINIEPLGQGCTDNFSNNNFEIEKVRLLVSIY